jgi:hypothetical protein
MPNRHVKERLEKYKILIPEPMVPVRMNSLWTFVYLNKAVGIEAEDVGQAPN